MIDSDSLSSRIRSVLGVSVVALHKHNSTKAGSLVQYDSYQFDRDPVDITTLNRVSKHRDSSNVTRVVFVPKVGSYPGCSAMHLDFSSTSSVYFRTKSLMYVVASNSGSEQPSVSILRNSLRDVRDLVVCYNIAELSFDYSLFHHVSPAVLSNTLFRTLGRICKYTFSSKHSLHNDTIRPEVFAATLTSGLNMLPNKAIVEAELEVPDLVLVPTPSPVSCHVEILQILVDQVFLGKGFIDQRLDAWMVHNYDLDVHAGDLSYNRTKGVFKYNTYDYLSPVLKTPMPHIRNETNRESLLALAKRNRNVPDMAGVVDVSKSSEDMLDSFLLHCCSYEKIVSTRFQEMRVSPFEISEWLENQKHDVVNHIVPTFAMHMTALNEYMFSIKRTPKPNLTPDCSSTYAALQTIVYHEKSVNAVFCSLFREIKRRVVAVLRNDVVMYTDMSPLDLENHMNNYIGTDAFFCFSGDDSLLFDGSSSLEIDISKYDKSQGDLALHFECALMRYFGTPDYFVHLWFNAHVLTKIYSRNTKLKCLVPYQRKSGDASTFLGNTLFLMGVISSQIPLSRLVPGSLRYYTNVTTYSLLYNLEVKFFRFKYMYFCSKYLLRCQGQWFFSPDPIKLLCKLGRNDLVNYNHVECYRVSVADHVKNFSDFALCVELSDAVRERHAVDFDFSWGISSMAALSDRLVFNSLYYIDDNALIDDTRLDFSMRD
uniref:RdRp catalytic domain-containing protein n=1 Tax=Hubei negev-like virus 1 TaxID=1922963 RepID=A0A1L3KK25_9VIRU|nr:hypothetical protein [Hubei negev-like virus 1]